MRNLLHCRLRGHHIDENLLPLLLLGGATSAQAVEVCWVYADV